MTARDSILARLRAARGAVQADTMATVTARQKGPGPAPYGDRISRFTERARSLASTVIKLDGMDEVPGTVSTYIAEHRLEPAVVCWPELQGLDWAGARLNARFRSASPSDLIGVTGAFAAIAETGTLVMASGEATPAATSLLPETHIAVLPASRILDTMEEVFALLRTEWPAWPRAVNLISGPSRTADIEQTVTLGAHGPYRVLILVLTSR